jgi:hypothetical protein
MTQLQGISFPPPPTGSHDRPLLMDLCVMVLMNSFSMDLRAMDDACDGFPFHCCCYCFFFAI